VRPALAGTARVMPRRYRKGDARRLWRNYWPAAGSFFLAMILVAAFVWMVPRL
jgi:hypothetical protein